MSKYGFQFCGGCLGNLVPDGSNLSVDTVGEISPMDVVSVVLKRIDGPFAEFVNTVSGEGFMGVCKLFLGTKASSTGETVYLVGQLSPPLISPIPAGAIEALHRVSDGDLPEDAPERITDEDQAALALLMPFATGDAVSPINPDWLPYWPDIAEVA